MHVTPWCSIIRMREEVSATYWAPGVSCSLFPLWFSFYRWDYRERRIQTHTPTLTLRRGISSSFSWSDPVRHIPTNQPVKRWYLPHLPCKYTANKNVYIDSTYIFVFKIALNDLFASFFGFLLFLSVSTNEWLSYNIDKKLSKYTFLHQRE